MYEIIELYNASRGFCIYSMTDNGEYDKMFVMIQYENSEDILNIFCDGDIDVYNYLLQNGWIYGNIVFSYYYAGSQESLIILSLIYLQLPKN